MDVVRVNSGVQLQEDGAILGELVFSRHDGKMVIEHVGVVPERRGQGLAKVLVLAAVDWAREAGLKIVPVCPYAQAVLRRDPGVADVLA